MIFITDIDLNNDLDPVYDHNDGQVPEADAGCGCDLLQQADLHHQDPVTGRDGSGTSYVVRAGVYADPDPAKIVRRIMQDLRPKPCIRNCVCKNA